jgi:hypothetical protein
MVFRSGSLPVNEVLNLLDSIERISSRKPRWKHKTLFLGVPIRLLFVAFGHELLLLGAGWLLI